MKKNNIIVSIMLILSLLVAPCTSTTVVAKSNSVVLNNKKVQLKIGKTKKIKLKNAPKKVKWKVKDKSIVKIVKKTGKKNNTIKIKGLKAGKTKIIARCNKVKYVIKVTVKENKVINDSNKEVTTEEITSENMEKEATVEITSRLRSDKITVDGALDIEVNVTASDENIITTYDLNPGQLEFFENDDWKSVSSYYINNYYNNSKTVIQGSGKGNITVILAKYYKNLKEGHYRYTHIVGDEEVAVEFDVYPIGTKVVGKVEDDSISMQEYLKIRFYPVGYLPKPYDFTERQQKLELYEQGEWIQLELSTNATYNEEAHCVWTEDDGFYLYVGRDYIGVIPGHYRYTHDVGGCDVTVEFDIVE